ncbi:MAG: alpha-glucan family phosphorylase [Thermoflexales bacterium]|nr:alpha-glucan family phosphorylase [Thermoflexales bacterium]MDW8293301.1 alpha-glucan family phosphorylase [Anaerolineae bacterium]
MNADDPAVESLCSLLPRRIHQLGVLAYNLWWSWHPEAQKLFQRIDPVLWEAVYHNPVCFLRRVPRQTLAAAINRAEFLRDYDEVMREFEHYMRGHENGAATWFSRYEKAWPLEKGPVAYFSFEFGLHEVLPMYAGGLGVLAADHLKEASDLGVPMVGVGFLYVHGYFKQRITEDGWQEAIFERIDFSRLPITQVRGKDGQPLVIALELPGRNVHFQVWKAQVGRVPLYLIDTDLPLNEHADRVLTQRLYDPDPDTRLDQEIVLGIGGVRLLRALGIEPAVWHLNEGHPVFATLERVRELVAQGLTFEEARERVRRNTLFTTHTPVPAGNDRFPRWLVERHFNGYWEQLGLTREAFLALGEDHESFGVTPLALRMSAKANGVSELHGQVARAMWQWMYPDRETPITHITNGVHVRTWLARRMKALLDEYLGANWLNRLDDPITWQLFDELPDEALWSVRKHLKRKLASFMRERARAKWVTHSQHPVQTIASGVMIDPNALTIGFARRFATYKRATLILRDLPRLLRIINNPARPVQIIFAGKAHPNDEPGKRFIQELYRVIKNADTAGRMVFIEDYDMNVARHLVQGVDVWLNTPRRPYEASGTSGMKAAINGALNFSVLDGWWREAWNGKNGWAIGEDRDYDDPEAQDRADAESLYNILEEEIVPLYYATGSDDIPHEWLKRVRESMRTIMPQFSTRRMLKQYVSEMYAPLAAARDEVIPVAAA